MNNTFALHSANKSRVKPFLTSALLLAQLFIFNQAFAQTSADIHFDKEAAKTLFNRICLACHVIADKEGTVIAGLKTNNGPNLYALSSFAQDLAYKRYGKSLKAAKEQNLVWDEEGLTAYLLNPKGYLEQKLSVEKASNRMAFYLKNKEEAKLLAQYLLSFKADEK